MTHKDYLIEAFLLSTKANANDIKPNPFVGALVVAEDGTIIGKGFHQKIGESHAEVFAINEALSKQNDLSNTTLYVTLEPCSHFGKTPPCTNLILEKKIKKVVVGMLDPNPKVSGIESLQANNVEVIVEELDAIKHFNQFFIISQKHNRPKYFVKTAQTIDGFIADRKGNSKWLTNDESRQYVHDNLRPRVDAIITTYKTVITDNASFNIRLNDGKIKEQNVVVVDRDLQLLNDENKHLKIFYERHYSKIFLVTDSVLETKLPDNVEIIEVDFDHKNVNLNQLSEILFNKKFYEVLVEAGGTLNAAFSSENLVDELWLYIAPKIMNDFMAVNSFRGVTETKMMQLEELQLLDIIKFDDDILLKYQNNNL